ncbi:MAG: TetR/AcrR family transcriptional regulator, partial [Phenylobacterium sp.]|nr:TetR/AcrR family transcriptional regulator [Phenylobacterium sp.]
MRRRQIVAAAAALAVEQGFLPLPPERLARAVGVSKALVYGYFPDQHELFNAVLIHEFSALEAAGLEAASQDGPLEATALA